VYWAPGKPQGDDDRSLPPTLAIEIRSRRQAMELLREKCRRMRENGVDVCWIVDPERRCAEVFERELDADPRAEGEVLESKAIPGFAVDLKALFAVLE
jgi:Uma2 family endonuclease